jgi:hypothetical protein
MADHVKYWSVNHKVLTLGPHTGHSVRDIAFCYDCETADLIASRLCAFQNGGLVSELVEALKQAQDFIVSTAAFEGINSKQIESVIHAALARSGG